MPYHYPIRLFVEAKHRSAATGLADVRNALGVINDVNEHYSTDLAKQTGVNYRRYDYRYALFSASGFAVNAQRFAVAQQISLIDLRGTAFAWLLDADALAEVVAQATDYVDRHLYWGYTDAPFVVLVRPDEDADLGEMLVSKLTPTASRLRFGGLSPDDGEWVLATADDALALRAATSPAFEALLLGEGRA